MGGTHLLTTYLKLSLIESMGSKSLGRALGVNAAGVNDTSEAPMDSAGSVALSENVRVGFMGLSSC